MPALCCVRPRHAAAVTQAEMSLCDRFAIGYGPTCKRSARGGRFAKERPVTKQWKISAIRYPGPVGPSELSDPSKRASVTSRIGPVPRALLPRRQQIAGDHNHFQPELLILQELIHCLPAHPSHHNVDNHWATLWTLHNPAGDGTGLIIGK